jgi:hypothetical protein
MAFKTGDWVIFTRPGHQWNKAQFKILKVYDFYISGYNKKRYALEYGIRLVEAEESEIELIDDQLDFGMFNPDSEIWHREYSPPKLASDCEHEVIPNVADGKWFKVCRKCKKEIF